ncbi:DEAD/DEAH-box helicase (macronuclear) [Tetrahymena thermophila SB210]|uniref:RNA helicase n=1 Tax=Tetrahymena thermophila (strain SB210) TaxID=312017 RepID=I7MEI4_TETTS|nr:DEAD/DEAH-box helicase [Tetrahymena thermophila SB210]EAR96415.2 DEAD/DEAH-box helicase [Tetrahymena thermophila SB210]|eukprot:XP_001016660.2 DEAD/DEAH-box helicase [Tetrahymena thermophila SB210]
MINLLKISSKTKLISSLSSSASAFKIIKQNSENLQFQKLITKQLYQMSRQIQSNSNKGEGSDYESHQSSDNQQKQGNGYFNNRNVNGQNQNGYQSNGYNNRGGYQKSYGTNKYNNGNGYGNSNGGYFNNNNKPNGYFNANKKFGNEEQKTNVDNQKPYGYNQQNNNQSNKDLNNSGYSDENHLGENLHDIDYTKVELKPFQKVFYQVGKSIHTDEEIATYQREKGIIIRSKHKEVPQPFIKWNETKFPKYIMSVIEDSKFSEPMPIQAQSFPIVLSGHDLIGIAQTGSGKTLSFMLPALVHINAQDPVKPGEGPIALVLAPTRELANQIQEQCFKFGSKCKISSVCVYGGAPKIYQEKELRNGCDIVIATPGRLIDFLESNVIDLKRVTYLVLDEADRMLDMGFEPSIRKIVGQIRPDRQTLMFSATWPQTVRRLALDFCHGDPIHIQIGDMENNVNNDIDQQVEIIDKSQKYDRVKEILSTMTRSDKTIIFTQTKKDCDDLSKALQTDNIRNICIHGDKSQRDRDKVMDLFKTGRVNTLIATDVASRGLDVKDIKLVINYDFPKQIEDYVHRVGRTGRAGAQGKAISFLDQYEDKKISKELVDVLKQNNQEISQDLLELSEANYKGNYSNNYNKNRSSKPYSGGYNNNRNYYGNNNEMGFRNSNNGFSNNGYQNGNSNGGYRSQQNNNGFQNNNYNRDFPKRQEDGNGGSEQPKKFGFFNPKKDN